MSKQHACLTQENVYQYLHGRLSAADDVCVENHLRECASCLRTISAAVEIDTLVETALTSAKIDKEIEASSPQVTALLAKLRTLRAENAAPPTLPAGQGGDSGPNANLAILLGDLMAPPRGSGELGWIGHFRVTAQIGQGGMGVVYRAEDTKLKREVAIKAIRPKDAARKETRQRFLREAQGAAHVVHPNIVPIFHVDESNGFPFIVMPLLKGQSLQDRLQKEKSLPLEEVCRIGKQIAAGLAAAHAQGLIHRDIKPANIWLEHGADGQVVKILDFGLARPSEALGDADDPKSLDGHLLGTPEYMSPQQARGEPVDFRTDLYSLGVVLYRLAAGKLPFAAATLQGQLVAHASETPTDVRILNPTIPALLCDTIMQLLEKDPLCRPVSAQALATTFERLLLPNAAGESQPVHAGLYEAKPRRLGPRPVISLLVLGLTAAVALWFFGSPALEQLFAPVQPPMQQTLIAAIERTVDAKNRLFTPDTPEKLAGLLPLRPGDHLELNCDVPRGYQTSCFLLDTEGKLRALEPMQVRTIGALDRVRFPAPGVWHVEGPAGTALFFVFANRREKPLLDDVQRLLRECGRADSRLPAPEQDVLILMNRDEVLKPFGDTVRDIVETPYSQLRQAVEQIRAQASRRFEFIWGAAVPVRKRFSASGGR